METQTQVGLWLAGDVVITIVVSIAVSIVVSLALVVASEMWRATRAHHPLTSIEPRDDDGTSSSEKDGGRGRSDSNADVDRVVAEVAMMAQDASGSISRESLASARALRLASSVYIQHDPIPAAESVRDALPLDRHSNRETARGFFWETRPANGENRCITVGWKMLTDHHPSHCAKPIGSYTSSEEREDAVVEAIISTFRRYERSPVARKHLAARFKLLTPDASMRVRSFIASIAASRPRSRSEIEVISKHLIFTLDLPPDMTPGEIVSGLYTLYPALRKEERESSIASILHRIHSRSTIVIDQ